METAGEVGARIRAIRHRRGLTQAALAARIGRTANTLALLEMGRSAPPFEILRLLAMALDAPLRDFFAAPEEEAGNPWEAALIRDVLDGARRLPPGELDLAARIVGLIAARYGR